MLLERETRRKTSSSIPEAWEPATREIVPPRSLWALHLGIAILAWACSSTMHTEPPMQTYRFTELLDKVALALPSVNNTKFDSEEISVLMEKVLRNESIAGAHLAYPEVLEEAFAKGGFRPLVTGGPDGLEPAHILLKALQAADDQGLRSVSYHAKHAKVELAELEALSLQLEGDIKDLVVREEERQALEKHLTRTEDPAFYEAAGEEAVQRLVGQLTEPGATNPLPSLGLRWAEVRDMIRRGAGLRAKVELLLADGLAGLAVDLRYHRHRSLPDDQGGPEQIKGPEDQHRALVALLGSLRGSAEMEGALRTITPPNPQYLLLAKGLAMYREMAKAGGWEPVPANTKMKAGLSYPEVPPLRARLAAEGYLKAQEDDSDMLDQPLVDAIMTYQETHQMVPDGKPTKALFENLNVPLERRLAQIRENLSRWRDTAMWDDSYYVFINVSDFHGEVWREDQRLHRFKIVAGNRKVEYDPRKRRCALVNATPLQSSKIDRIIYNPYWNVPDRIRRDEIDEKIMANPQFLEENRYEIVTRGERDWIRQLPGPGNALGVVKIIFPNPHDTYLHDTPAKKLFAKPVRAFSHGCMRVQFPLDLARLILTEDGQFDEARERRYLASQREKVIYLKEMVSVHIEYYSVRMDDEGRVQFLDDPYYYVRDAIDGPRSIRWCPRPKKPPKRPVVGTEDSPEGPDPSAPTVLPTTSEP